MRFVYILAEEFVMQTGRKYLARPLLIISYESFRSHAATLHRGAVGLMICDEVRPLTNYNCLMWISRQKFRNLIVF